MRILVDLGSHITGDPQITQVERVPDQLPGSVGGRYHRISFFWRDQHQAGRLGHLHDRCFSGMDQSEAGRHPVSQGRGDPESFYFPPMANAIALYKQLPSPKAVVKKKRKYRATKKRLKSKKKVNSKRRIRKNKKRIQRKKRNRRSKQRLRCRGVFCSTQRLRTLLT